jgi:UDP-N-acetyl-2-amino-2-deoxyglucuronate dehydrogenase
MAAGGNRTTGTRLGIGVVGLGRISPTHIDAFRSLAGTRVAAVCDIVREKTDEAGTRLGVAGYADYHDLIADPAVNAVSILLPHRLHHAAARAALEAGKHVCIEKPLAVTTAECTDLVALARERNLTLSVTQNLRFVPAYVEADRLVRAGTLGEIRLVRCVNAGYETEGYLHPGPGDEWRKEKDGIGALIDVALHYLYLYRWMFGDVTEVNAVAHNVLPDMGVEDYALASGRFAGGGSFSVEVTLTADVPWQERLEIYGSEASILVNHRVDPVAILYRGHADTTGTPLSDVPFDPKGWREASIAASVADFVDAVLAGRAPIVDPEHAAYAVTLVEKAHESIAARGAAIAL